MRSLRDDTSLMPAAQRQLGDFWATIVPNPVPFWISSIIRERLHPNICSKQWLGLATRNRKKCDGVEQLYRNCFYATLTISTSSPY